MNCELLSTRCCSKLSPVIFNVRNLVLNYFTDLKTYMYIWTKKFYLYNVFIHCKCMFATAYNDVKFMDMSKHQNDRCLIKKIHIGHF